MLKNTKEKLIKNYLLPNSQTIDLRLIKEPFELDENLILDYNLLISNNSFIKKLPNKLHIKGKLEIANTKIINLPNDLKVLGSLDIRNTKISKLPNGVIGGENLSMRGSLIKTLPEKCSIVGNILMSFGQLTEIPKNAKFNGIVKTGFETDNGGLKYIKTIFKQDIDKPSRDNEFFEINGHLDENEQYDQIEEAVNNIDFDEIKAYYDEQYLEEIVLPKVIEQIKEIEKMSEEEKENQEIFKQKVK